MEQIGNNTLTAIELFQKHRAIEKVCHTGLGGEAQDNYEALTRRGGKHPTLLSVELHDGDRAHRFYDLLDLPNGASFRTNFTMWRLL